MIDTKAHAVRFPKAHGEFWSSLGCDHEVWEFCTFEHFGNVADLSDVMWWVCTGEWRPSRCAN